MAQATNSMPPPMSPRVIVSDNTHKRKASEVYTSSSGCFQLSVDTDVDRHIPNTDDYVVLYVPKRLANSLQKFLDNSAESLKSGKLDVIDTSVEDPVFDHDNTEMFKSSFETLKREFGTIVSKFKDSDLKNDVKPELLDDFKHLRTTLSKWHHACSGAYNKLAKPSKSNDLLKLGFSISPAVKDDKAKDIVHTEINNVKAKCDKILSVGVLDEAYKLNSEVSSILSEAHTTTNADKKFLIAKIYRKISRGSSFPSQPSRPTYPKGNRPQFNQDRYHRQPNTYYRSNRNEDYENYHNRRTYHSTKPRQYSESEDEHVHRNRRPQRVTRRYSESEDETYDRDFAPYDGKIKQVKERYLNRKPFNQGRPRTDSSNLEWV
jgi:hypothetical protein